MLSKCVLIAATIFVVAQALDWQKEPKGSKARGNYEEIGNETYFVDSFTKFYRDDAKVMCESINMTLISFEGDEQKWRSINTWLIDNGMELYYFWSDGIRDKNSAEWYWETTKNSILENDFHWASQQPSMSNDTVRSCISFSNYDGGYADDDCLDYTLDVICQ